MTPLMAACLNCHPRIVQLLLTNGADPDLRDSNNSTALTFAQRSDCLESTELLLKFGTDSFPQTADLDKVVSDLDKMVSDIYSLYVNMLPDLDTDDEGTSPTHM